MPVSPWSCSSCNTSCQLVTAFSTVNLSSGQRKRLALVVACLEDRPFYVFDEWAADQDPEFKTVFYEQLLPDLKGRGKGVAVISHDDRHFYLGDRVFKLDTGQVVVTEIPDSGHQRAI